MTGQTGLQPFAGVVGRLDVGAAAANAVCCCSKVARGLACVGPGDDQKGLVKWNQVKVEGGPCWVFSLVGSGITSPASVGRLWGSQRSLKRALVIGQ